MVKASAIGLYVRLMSYVGLHQISAARMGIMFPSFATVMSAKKRLGEKHGKMERKTRTNQKD
jgi:hypothetical protein